jgi:ribosomal 50S subunit-recycling heat shock protein
MKKALWYVVGTVFLLSTLVFAADKAASPDKAVPVKTNIVKAAKMHATGKVVEISDESIKIERTVKGDAETMEFALEKPVKNIIIGDSVKIAYMEKDGKLIASRVAKVISKKKEIKPAEATSASGKK